MDLASHLLFKLKVYDIARGNSAWGNIFCCFGMNNQGMESHCCRCWNVWESVPQTCTLSFLSTQEAVVFLVSICTWHGYQACLALQKLENFPEVVLKNKIILIALSFSAPLAMLYHNAELLHWDTPETIQHGNNGSVMKWHVDGNWVKNQSLVSVHLWSPGANHSAYRGGGLSQTFSSFKEKSDTRHLVPTSVHFSQRHRRQATFTRNLDSHPNKHRPIKKK